MASIGFAVFFAVIMRSAQLGTYDRMISNVVKSSTGYIQLNAKGYHEDPSLDVVFAADDSLMHALRARDEVTAAYPRVSGYALAAGPHSTRGVAVMGLDMAAERQNMDLDDKLKKGRIPVGGRGVFLGTDLASYFDFDVGDTLVMIGQGHYGASAAGKYAVAGIGKFPTPEMDGSVVMMPLELAREFFSMPGLATEVLIDISDPDDLDAVRDRLLAHMDSTRYELHTWRELMPELVQGIQADNAGGLIMIFVLYLVVGFGIFGTILMMTQERQYEFGVSVAIGMRRVRLVAIMVMEIALLALLGAAIGIALSYPVAIYFHHHPISLAGGMKDTLEDYGWEPVLAASADIGIPLINAALIWFIAMVLAIYPIQNILRLNPMDAMKD